MKNTSGIEPTEFNVLIRQKEIDGMVGSIHLPDAVRDREQAAAIDGTIIAMSPVAFTYEDWPEGSRQPAPGDEVYFSKYAGLRIKGRDGNEYLIVKDKDIVGLKN